MLVTSSKSFGFFKFAVASANSKSNSKFLPNEVVTDFKVKKNKGKKRTRCLFLRRQERGQLSPLKFKILTLILLLNYAKKCMHPI